MSAGRREPAPPSGPAGCGPAYSCRLRGTCGHLRDSPAHRTAGKPHASHEDRRQSEIAMRADEPLLVRHADLIFALKTFAASMLALVIALWLDLPRPYWAMATVYITSQPLAGATSSKALYRVLGTLAGATASVAIVPTFVNAPELLCLVIALWVGGCLYVSLLDRTPRSYLF